MISVSKDQALLTQTSHQVFALSVQPDERGGAPARRKDVRRPWPISGQQCPRTRPSCSPHLCTAFFLSPSGKCGSIKLGTWLAPPHGLSVCIPTEPQTQRPQTIFLRGETRRPNSLLLLLLLLASRLSLYPRIVVFRLPSTLRNRTPVAAYSDAKSSWASSRHLPLPRLLALVVCVSWGDVLHCWKPAQPDTDTTTPPLT